MKRATWNKANKQGIRTVKLPLREHCTMSSTPVLTVNHVFEILVRFHELGCWAKAFEQVLPQRKGVATSAVNERESASSGDRCEEKEKEDDINTGAVLETEKSVESEREGETESGRKREREREDDEQTEAKD
mmetsp:Transcript_22270/g.22441  ORF Transcript_22270/g.22441 Transcript_22270/m.22441 type:complete len:132 (+) Transcript_22270:603-998(+)